LPPPIKSSRRVMLDKEELDTGVSVEDTDETTGDVTSGSGDGFISGNNFKFWGAGTGVHCKSFQRVVNVFISSRPASNTDARPQRFASRCGRAFAKAQG
jgi:hypothetical protein